MKTFNGLPVYQMTIDENDTISGVEFISLVDCPAIEVNWVAMDDKKRLIKLSTDDQQIITGPIMIPNLPIYRFDKQLGEYYVMFTVEQCKAITRKFLKQGRTLGFNYMHKEDSQVATAQIDEIWYIKDKEFDYSKKLGYDLPIGTPMVTTYIADKAFWNKEVKSGNVRGFSIEGWLNLEMNKINKNKSQTNMSKLKFEAEIKTVDGATLYTPTEFVVDAEVFVVDAEGNQTEAPEGDHTLENGSTITVVAGKITAVVEAVAQEAETEVALAITPEDLAQIVDALAPTLKALTDRIDALEAQNTEMKSLMSKIPGPVVEATPVVTKPVVMSLAQKLELLKKNK